MKRRIMKDLKESGGGRRSRKVGVYKIATYNKVIDVHATIAVVFDISLPSIAIVDQVSKIKAFRKDWSVLRVDFNGVCLWGASSLGLVSRGLLFFNGLSV